MSQLIEKFVNFGVTTVNMPGGFPANGTELIIANSSVLPVTGSTGQFHLVVTAFNSAGMMINPEVMIGTAINGSTITVQPAQEGSSPQAHANGETVFVSFTAGLLQAMYPAGRVVQSTSGAIQVQNLDGTVKIALESPAATSVLLPQNPIPFKPYSIVDGGTNFSAHPCTVTDPNGALINGQDEYPMNIAWQEIDFKWDGTTWGAA